MKSYLIQDTTREEREKIVAESIGSVEAACDGCAPGVAEMYQAYIDGEKELREINREYVARYVSGREGADKKRVRHVLKGVTDLCAKNVSGGRNPQKKH